MREVRTVRRLVVLTLFGSAVFVSAPVVWAQTSEIPGIEVSADLPATVHQAETFAVTFQLTNIGATAFDTVVVTAQDSCAPSSAGGLVEFTEIQGNGDAVLDPTEVWSYLAPRCVEAGAQAATLAVSASDGVDTLSGVYTFGYDAALPVAVEPIGDVSADECLVRRFDIPFSMVTGTSSQVPTAFLAYAITQEGGGLQVVAQVEFAEIVHVSVNDDPLYDPGEEFVAGFFFGTLTQCPDVPEPPLTLLLSMAGTSADSDATWCFGTEGCPTPAIQVGTIVELVAETAPTTTGPVVTDPTLPFTGPEAGVAWLAGACLVCGVLILVGAARRGRGGNV